MKNRELNKIYVAIRLRCAACTRTFSISVVEMVLCLQYGPALNPYQLRRAAYVFFRIYVLDGSLHTMSYRENFAGKTKEI